MEGFPWFFAVVGGTIILAAGLAYAVFSSHKANRKQRDAAERAARDLYHKDQSKDH